MKSGQELLAYSFKGKLVTQSRKIIALGWCAHFIYKFEANSEQNFKVV